MSEDKENDAMNKKRKDVKFVKRKRNHHNILKTVVALLTFIVFMFFQGAVVVIGKMDRDSAIWARSVIIWGLVSITILYYWIRFQNIKVLGFQRIMPGSAKRLLFYMPLIVIAFLYFVTGYNFGESPNYVIANVVLTLGIGMAEEIYFRGIICNIWLEKSIHKAILISAILFALSHLLKLLGGRDPTITILQICFTFVYGMVFAMIFTVGKSLIPCVLLHAFHNFCCYLSAEGTIAFMTLLAVIQSTILVIYFIYLLYTNIRKKSQQIQ